MSQVDKCHFIGIGGIGMSGLARIMLKQKLVVSGSDIAESAITEGLREEGANIFIGHSAKYITPGSTVIYGSDIKGDNPEFAEAKKLQCSLWHRSDLLSHLMSGYQALSVAGTHGKTTTSALLTWVLKEAGLDPSFAVGGVIPTYATNAGYGEGKLFVAEADESDGSFQKYCSYGAIITNIGLDHLSHYGSEERLIHAFEAFIEQVSSRQHLMWCGDDQRLKSLVQKGVSYGFSKGCDWQVVSYQQIGWKSVIDVQVGGRLYEGIEVALIGKHNVLNTVAVFALALLVGADEAMVRQALKVFPGVKRRCERVGSVGGVSFIDDYAHHPTEIKTTLEGIRQAVGEQRLVVLFQPHRYSRTSECLGSYGAVFNEADILVVTDIYASREDPIPGVTVEAVYEEIANSFDGECCYIPRDLLVPYFSDVLRPHDVVVTLGAGDVTRVGREMVPHLKNIGVTKLVVGVVYGGKSSEHAIAIRSAKYVTENLNPSLYEGRHFLIDQEGGWHLTEGVKSYDEIHPSDEQISHSTLKEFLACDVIVPMIHGPHGEDGTIQGLFEMMGKAYVGPDHQSAAICMDKSVAKLLARAHQIPTLDYITFTKAEWKENPERVVAMVLEKLIFPVFVKPVHQGSSVGISKVVDINSLREGCRVAVKYDTAFIVEQGICGRELEFAVVGNNKPIATQPGEICLDGAFYDFKKKYDPSIKVSPKADLTPEKVEEGRALALRVYRALGCSVMARIDFFLDKKDQFWFNEANPIPGMTKTSLFPMMCQSEGYSSLELMDRLVVLALERRRDKDSVELSLEELVNS